MLAGTEPRIGAKRQAAAEAAHAPNHD
jgi:hypothetical protein